MIGELQVLAIIHNGDHDTILLNSYLGSKLQNNCKDKSNYYKAIYPMISQDLYNIIWVVEFQIYQ